MLKSKEIETAIGELPVVVGQDVAAKTVIAMRTDLAEFSRSQAPGLPYLFGVIPTSLIAGNGDDCFYFNDMLEIYVAHRIVSKESLADRLAHLDQCAAVVEKIIPYIQQQITAHQGFWQRVQLAQTPIDPQDIDQMSGYIVILKCRKDI